MRRTFLAIEGRFQCRTIRDGKTWAARKGKNICTAVGKELLIQQIMFGSGGARLRSDVLRYIGVGTGNQPAVASLTSLIAPVVYLPGTFLAPLDMPVGQTLENDALSMSARYGRTYARGEISLGSTVLVSEAGLFTNGDPRNGWSVPGPTDLVTAGAFTPMFYKSFEPIPIGPEDDGFEIQWEIRIL